MAGNADYLVVDGDTVSMKAAAGVVLAPAKTHVNASQTFAKINGHAICTVDDASNVLLMTAYTQEQYALPVGMQTVRISTLDFSHKKSNVKINHATALLIGKKSFDTSILGAPSTDTKPTPTPDPEQPKSGTGTFERSQTLVRYVPARATP